MLKLWGRTNSINVQKVVWALEEMNVPYSRTEAGMEHGVVNTPEYLRMNPNARVPTIDDEGFVLWESNAVVRYLAAKHGAGTLWPTDAQQRADTDRWMDWVTANVQPVITPVFWQLIRNAPDKRDAKVVADNTTASHKVFAILESALAGHDYISGNTLTMGDMVVGPFVHRYLQLPIEHPALPNVRAYYARIKQRPGYARHIDKPLT